jgi:hypothetical protein
MKIKELADPANNLIPRTSMYTPKRERSDFSFAGRLNLWSWVIPFLAVFMVSACSTLRDAPARDVSTHQMSLSHHEFEAWTFLPLPRDRIEIINHSNIAHAIYITYPDGTVVNMGVQLPGATVNWTVPDDGDGEYLLQCWIHPIIRATLTVKAPVAQ